MNPTDRVIEAIRAQGIEPKRDRNGWTCCCPSHEEKRPSFSVSTGNDGRALVICRTGCTTEAICEALGLKVSDLFADAPAAPRRRGDGDTTPKIPARKRGSVTVASVTNAETEPTFPTYDAALAALDRTLGRRSKHWIYQDAQGVPACVMGRWDTPKGKTYRPVSRNGTGWEIGGMAEPKPLYRLPELLARSGERLYIAEGEKCADALAGLGLLGTTSPHGSQSASKADWTPCAGRDVVILPDRDEAGEGYTADVLELATKAGAKSVRVVRLADAWPDIPKGGDVVDLLAHHGGDVDATRAEIESLVSKAEPEATEAPDTPACTTFIPFPTKALPEPIRSFVSDAAAAIGCDASYVALPLLAGLASAIGNSRKIVLKRGWSEPAIVWVAIVGESGTAKSPALELALCAIRKRQHDAMKRHAQAMKDYADALAVYERDAANWKKSKSDTPPPTKPEEPVVRRTWTEDTTIEALAVLLKQNPRGLLNIRDELAGWFNFDRYAGGKGGGDVARWIEMFGGRPMITDRRGGGTNYVPRAAVSIVGGIQPETLRRALGQEHRDNGLAARLLLSCPPRKPKRWTEAEVSEAIEAAVANVFERLYGLAMEPDGEGDERPVTVPLSPSGKAAWVGFFNTHNEEQTDLSGDLSAAWSKLEGYAARLALVIHLTRWAADDSTLEDATAIDADSIAVGVTLARWFGNEARRVYAILGESDEDREARRLVEWIERRGGSVTTRDLTRGLREYRQADKARKVLDELAAAGVGRWECDTHGPKGGRPADRFRLLSGRGDTGDGDETHEIPVDSGGCVTVAKDADAEEWGEA